VPRKYEKYNTKSLKDALPELHNSNVEIYFDVENQKNFKRISDVLNQAGAKKVKRIMAVILKNEYYEHIYKLEDKNITTIKLTAGKSKNQNYRIYCKEIFNDGKKVVLITPHIKKVQKNRQDTRIAHIINSIKNYEYEF
jgi:hypothetical protein